MKQFNLDEYLANPSRKVVTRDGRSVRIICTDRRNIKCPIVALVENECDEKICSYSKGGRFFYKDLSSFDLFFASEDDTEEPIITCDNIPLKWSWGKLNVEKFDVSALQPFDKVLVRNHSTDPWRTTIFGYIIEYPDKTIDCAGFYWKCCIPYNEETKHLVGTKEDCPEYYKWWEE